MLPSESALRPHLLGPGVYQSRSQSMASRKFAKLGEFPGKKVETSAGLGLRNCSAKPQAPAARVFFPKLSDTPVPSVGLSCWKLARLSISGTVLSKPEITSFALQSAVSSFRL